MRKVCAKMVPRTSLLSRRPIRGKCVLIFWTALRGGQNSSVALSQVMNHGFWSTTPQQNAKFGGSSTRKVCCQDKLSIKLIGQSWKDSGREWHVCDQALHALGCCTTAKPHVTRQPPSMNFWEKKHSCGSSAPLFAGSESLWLLFILPTQKPLERAPFWYFG